MYDIIRKRYLSLHTSSLVKAQSRRRMLKYTVYERWRYETLRRNVLYYELTKINNRLKYCIIQNDELVNNYQETLNALYQQQIHLTLCSQLRKLKNWIYHIH